MNIVDLNQVLTEHLLYKLLIPLYIYSLTGFRNTVDVPETSALLQLPSSSNSEAYLESIDHLDTANGRVSSVVALFLLSQVFLIISHAPLVRTLAWIILKADRSIFEKDSKELVERCFEAQTDFFESKCTRKTAVPTPEPTKEEKKSELTEPGSDKPNVPIKEQKNATDEEKLLVTTPSENICVSPFFEAVVKALDCSENDYTALFALSLLYALGNNKG